MLRLRIEYIHIFAIQITHHIDANPCPFSRVHCALISFNSNHFRTLLQLLEQRSRTFISLIDFLCIHHLGIYDDFSKEIKQRAMKFESYSKIWLWKKIVSFLHIFSENFTIYSYQFRIISLATIFAMRDNSEQLDADLKFSQMLLFGQNHNTTVQFKMLPTFTEPHSQSLLQKTSIFHQMFIGFSLKHVFDIHKYVYLCI